MPAQPSLLPKLDRMADDIPPPTDFFTGTPTAGGAFPDNILFFTRRGARSMGLNPRLRSQHHRAVLVVSLRGSGYVCADAENFAMAPGDALLLFPFQFHGYADAYDISWLFITFEMLAYDSLEPLRSTGPRRLGPVEEILLQETLRARQEGGSLLGQHFGLFLERLARLRKNTPAASPPDDQLSAREWRTHMLAKVNSFAIPLIGDPAATPDIPTLARRMKLSESHLRAQFRRSTGRSLGAHLRGLRIQKACSLLHTTRLPITEVARLCGFDSVYSFSRTFRAMRGVPPSEYRKGVVSMPGAETPSRNFGRAPGPVGNSRQTSSSTGAPQLPGSG